MPPGGGAPGAPGAPNQGKDAKKAAEDAKKKKEALAAPSHFGRRKKKNEGSLGHDEAPQYLTECKVPPASPETRAHQGLPHDGGGVHWNYAGS